MLLKFSVILFSLTFLFAGCTKFDLTTLDKVEVKKLLSTPALNAIGIGLGLCDKKKKFYMGRENYYFEALDSLGISKENDSLFYYEYLSKYFEGINVSLKDIIVILRTNGKELYTFAGYSRKNNMSIINLEGDTELLDENITEFSLDVNYTISIEGHLKSNKKYGTIMQENQHYIILSKDNYIISANLVYKK
jgi:hypothetical protein